MGHWSDYFQKIYLINLDSRPDRLEHATRELSKYHIRFERFPAIKVLESKFPKTSGRLSCTKAG